MTAVRLQLIDVRRRYVGGGPLGGVRSANLSVAAGEAVLVTGPSGSGKSTLSRLTALWERPDRGTVLVDGTVVPWRRAHRWRGVVVGYVPQRLLLVPELSVQENLVLGLRAAGVGSTDTAWRMTAVCEQLDVRDLLGQPAGALSGGQAQRVALARALTAEPDVLVADEPTRSLDPPSLAATRHALVRWRSERPGRSLILVSHVPQDGELVDRSVVLADGRIG